mgnify:CR=1 FL=1
MSLATFNKSAILVSAIHAAFPDSRCKRLARILGISFATAALLVSRGQIGRKRLPEVIAALEAELERREAALRATRDELRKITYAEGVAQAAGGAANRAGPAPAMGA